MRGVQCRSEPCLLNVRAALRTVCRDCRIRRSVQISWMPTYVGVNSVRLLRELCDGLFVGSTLDELLKK